MGNYKINVILFWIKTKHLHLHNKRLYEASILLILISFFSFRGRPQNN